MLKRCQNNQALAKNTLKMNLNLRGKVHRNIAKHSKYIFNIAKIIKYLGMSLTKEF